MWADRMDWLLQGGNTGLLPPYRIAQLYEHISNVRRIWQGINAATFPLNFAAGQSKSVRVGEILYLVAVAFLWYFVGRFFDRRRGLGTPQHASTMWRKVRSILILVWGAFLIISAILLLPDAFPSGFAFGRFVRPALLATYASQVLWGLVLVAFSTRDLLQSIRQKLALTNVGT
jgi:hypothetical protein